MKKVIVTLVVLLTFFPSTTIAEWPDVDIDLSTCQPDGPFANIFQAWDPLEFWVKQYIRLEMALEEINLNHLLNRCKMFHSRNETKLIECYQFHKNRHRSIIQCFHHARILCRHHGGSC